MSKPEAANVAATGRCWETMRRPSAELLDALRGGPFATAKAAGQQLPGLHTSRFEPLPEPTLRTGVTAMVSVAIALLQNQ